MVTGVSIHGKCAAQKEARRKRSLNNREAKKSGSDYITASWWNAKAVSRWLPWRGDEVFSGCQSHIPVSYTHLDVYKRQGHCKEELLRFKRWKFVAVVSLQSTAGDLKVLKCGNGNKYSLLRFYVQSLRIHFQDSPTTKNTFLTGSQWMCLYFTAKASTLTFSFIYVT